MSVSRVRAIHRVYAFAALLALATLSLVLGTQLPSSWGEITISLVIAAAKTGLVLWFFMDLAEQPFRSRLAISVAVLLLVLLVGLTATDVATRLTTARGPRPEPTESFFQR